MSDVVVVAGGTAPPSRRPWRGVNRLFRRHRPLAVTALIGPAVGWLLVIYVASLVLLVISAFFRLDGFTGEPTSELTIDNVKRAFTTRSFLDVVVRSVVIAASVTVVCLVIALPAAFYIAKVARPWARRGLVVAILMPLWAGYLVKGYAWKAMLRPASAVRRRHERWRVRRRVRLDAGVRVRRRRPRPHLPVAAVHGDPDLRRARAPAADRARSVRRPRRQTMADVRRGGRADADPLDRRRQHLHVLAVARRLHHAAARHRRRA